MNDVGCVEDEVECEGVWLVPPLFADIDELFGTHFHRIFLFVGAVAEDVHLCPKSFREHDSEVTQSTHARDSNFLARAGAQSYERTVD